MNIFQKTWAEIKDFFWNITIEPVFLFFALAVGFYAVVAKNLYVDKGDHIINSIK